MIGRFELEPNRSRFGFPEEVKQAFDFLTTEFGFRCVGECVTCVRYESENTFVIISHGRGSYEIRVAVGEREPCGSDEDQYEIHEIMDVPDRPGHTHFQISTSREAVARSLVQLAGLLRQWGAAALAGDPREYERLRRVTKSRSDRLLRTCDLTRVRAQAEEAWQRKDYGCVYELYVSIAEDLTRVEKARLAYAQKQVSTAPSG